MPLKFYTEDEVKALLKKAREKRDERWRARMEIEILRATEVERATTRKEAYEELGALVHHVQARNPGQVTTSTSIHKSLVGAVYLTRKVRGDELVFETSLRSVEP